MSFTVTAVDRPVTGVRAAVKLTDAEAKAALKVINAGKAAQDDRRFASRKVAQTAAWNLRRALAAVGGVEVSTLASRTVEIEDGKFAIQVFAA